MGTVIDSYNQTGVERAVLEETGSGGILSDGYVRDDPLESYVGSDETVVFVLSNAKKGVQFERFDTGETGDIVPGDGYRAFAVLTDARIIFVVGDNESGDDGDCSITVPITDIDTVEGSEGLLATELAVTTRADVCWRFPCKRDLEDVLSYLDAAVAAWTQVETRLEDARKRVVDAADHRESHDYDAALAAIGDAKAELAAARRRERKFVDDGVPAIESRIERAADRVREANVETLKGRATHALDRAERRWRADEYRGAHDDFTAAHEDYVRALAASEDGLESSASLRERIARVERNLAALERAPVERAESARARADEADDPAERADHLERALERYRAALELDWGRERKRFESDTAAVRECVDAVASDLVETRRRLAERHVQRGETQRESGRPEQAAECYREARDVLEAANATARELVPGAVEALDERREGVDRRLGDLPLGATVHSPGDDGSGDTDTDMPAVSSD